MLVIVDPEPSLALVLGFVDAIAVFAVIALCVNYWIAVVLFTFSETNAVYSVYIIVVLLEIQTLPSCPNTVTGSAASATICPVDSKVTPPSLDT